MGFENDIYKAIYDDLSANLETDHKGIFWVVSQENHPGYPYIRMANPKLSEWQSSSGDGAQGYIDFHIFDNQQSNKRVNTLQSEIKRRLNFKIFEDIGAVCVWQDSEVFGEENGITHGVLRMNITIVEQND